MNKKGFTLIELLAVIVILGILMLIAIPSVTKYIDSSKKEAYVKTVSNMVDVVRYGVASENSNYSMEGKTKRSFSLKNVELEKGNNKSPYGDFIDEYSYVVVTKTNDVYKYEVQTKDTGNYCIELINIDDLDKSKIKKCEDSNMKEYSKAYKVGDKIEFAGSIWYVIKDSSKDEDYVTLLKEKILTNAELGSYGINYVCGSGDVNSRYGCTSEGEIRKINAMSYYWSDTCHDAGIYGYTKGDYSGCKNHNDYEGSKVKEFLDGAYINTLGKDNLKSVDGYKVRLISIDELRNNLGWTNGNISSTDGNNVPSWVHNGGTLNYLTMTPSISNNNNEIYGLCSDMIHESSIVNYWCYSGYKSGIRPVINLLKSSI